MRHHLRKAEKTAQPHSRYSSRPVSRQRYLRGRAAALSARATELAMGLLIAPSTRDNPNPIISLTAAAALLAMHTRH